MPNPLDKLNSRQREAVTHTHGPLLIIAGPGSGKTRTVAHSIAYAIENGVQPDRILAFSFTGKACGELTERVKKFAQKERGKLVQISTFHGFCRQVLRKDIEKLRRGYTRNFKELNQKTQEQVVSDQIAKVRAQINITLLQHHEFLKTKDILDFITRCKLQFIKPSVANEHVPHPEMPPEISRAYVEIYERYERVLEAKGWIDYANQLLLANELFTDVPEVKKEWQEKFELIFVDEYQDTDPVQYRIINALADHHENVRVVGDDDQGIYGWLGADIRNILNFEKNYSDAKEIPLGQNYRSTQQIVAASRALVEFNLDRRQKELFTRNFEGEKVKYFHCENAKEEIKTISSFIIRAIQYGWSSTDFAILCHLNEQVNDFKNGLRQYVDGVSVMTIHGAKGLEFPNVFVAGVCKGLLPYGKNKHNEERRLLYVAMTRAKNWLCLSSYENNVRSDANGRSPFLDQIPRHLLEPIQILDESHIPPKPIESNRTEPLIVDEELLEPIHPPIGPEVVLGIDPGKIDANKPNIGWAITQKSSAGYAVIACNTLTPNGTTDDKLKQIESQINNLIESYSPDAIAVEKLEGATDKGLIGVAGCVALVRHMANQYKIEYAFYSPQQVKYAATDNRNADKAQVQEGVKKRCDLTRVQNIIDDHSADAIAVSLCYLDSYLNSSRLQWQKKKQAHYNLGRMYLENGQYDASIDEFREAINIDPPYADEHCELGRAYLVQGNLSAAENSAKEALRLKANDYPPAQKLLDAIADGQAGLISLNDKQYAASIEKFRAAIKKEPFFVDAHCELGRAYLAQGNLEEGEKALEEVLRLDESNANAQKVLGAIKDYQSGVNCLDAKRYGAAIEELIAAIQKEQIFIDAYCELSRAYLGIGDNVEDAKSAAQKARGLKSDYLSVRNLLDAIKCYDSGRAFFNNDQYEEAIGKFQAAIDREPIFVDAHCELSRAYLGMGNNVEAAKSAAQKALRLKGDYPLAHNLFDAIARYNSGRDLFDNEQYEEASGKFQAAIEKEPIFMDAYCGLGRTYLEQGNLEAAVESARKVRHLDNNELWEEVRQAYIDKGRAALERGNLDVAERIAREARRIYKSNYPPVSELLNDIKQGYIDEGREALAQGNLNAAENFAEKAYELNKNCSLVRTLREDIRQVRERQNNSRRGNSSRNRSRGRRKRTRPRREDNRSDNRGHREDNKNIIEKIIDWFNRR